MLSQHDDINNKLLLILLLCLFLKLSLNLKICLNYINNTLKFSKSLNLFKAIYYYILKVYGS